MATRQIKVIISVQDAATKKMKKMERATRQVGKAADDASKRFMHFNRTLFTTTAFIGTFIGAFKSMSGVIDRAADFTRLQNAFKGIFGKNADVLKMVSDFTDTTIDEMDAMRASIRLSSKDLGLSQAEIAEILSRGAVAAKKAGLSAAEGAKAIAEAIRTGNIEAADNLNIINKGSIAYKAYEAAISKAAGTMSPAVKIMFRKKLIIQSLREATQGLMRDNRDLKDILIALRNSSRRLFISFGNLLGKSLGPLIDSFSKLAKNVAASITELAKNKKFVETAKYITITTTAVLGLAGAFGTLKLATIALGSFTSGFPGLIALLATGALAFAGITSKAESLNERFRVMVNFFKGIWQLVTNFSRSTGFSKMDKDVADLMVRMGLMTKEIKDGKVVYDGFLVQLSRGIILVKQFVVGLAEGIKTAFQAVLNVFNYISDKIKSLLNIKSGPWAKEWLSGAEALGKSFGILASVIGGLLALKGIKSLIGSLIPSFGGRGGKGPKGTPTDPIYTASVGGSLGAGFKGAKRVLEAGLLKKLFGKLGQRLVLLKDFLKGWNPFAKGNLSVILSRLGKIGTLFASGIRIIANVFSRFGSLAKLIVGSVGRVLVGLTSIPGLIAASIAGAAGYYVGKQINKFIDEKTQGENEYGFKGSAVERAMFWLDKKTGIFGGQADKIIAANEKLKALGTKEVTETAVETPLKKTPAVSQVTNPRNFRDEMAKVDEMASSIINLTGEKRAVAQQAVEAALETSSEGGASITKTEMAQFRALLEALNNSEVNKNLRTMVEEIKQPRGLNSSRRAIK